MSFKKYITHHLINIPGWRTNRKIVVIESDDWGSIRMPSKTAYNNLLNNGVMVDLNYYTRNDALERGDDIELLFEVLSSVKDSQSNPAKITANTLVANPDYEKIRSNNFEQYEFELITESYKRIKGCENSFDLLIEGNNSGLLSIQSHGREHLHVRRWMQYLKARSREFRLAFDNGVYGIRTETFDKNMKSTLYAMDVDHQDDRDFVNQIAVNGLDIFYNLFGYRSASFIAPNYSWSYALEEAIAKHGIRYIQGQYRHQYSVSANEKRPEIRWRYFGKNNDWGQIDLIRNAFFEPSENPCKDWVNSCLEEIQIAFKWKHPAVICTHRVNFMGGINPENRDRNLLLFKELLHKIVMKWPEVEFLSSNE
ncbi:MAG: hypothetical protein IT216_13295, partial [Saprospiraceae bacterium]|nr:hypothetical protein [Saprospiraceae bacterium]